MASNFSRYFQLDVFTANAGGGNPLGVLIDADDWSSQAMQEFAAWTNLVETTFLLLPNHSQADYQVRIFTPNREIAYAGHPSVGSAFAAIEAGRVRVENNRLLQECKLGLIPVKIEKLNGAKYFFVQAPTAQIVAASSIESIYLSRVVEGLKLVSPPCLLDGGRRWWIAEIEAESELRNWSPPHTHIESLAKSSNSLGLCVFARSESLDYDLAVRAFPAGVGIVEDPASGAANGMIASYVREQYSSSDLCKGYRVSQGREIGHDAEIVIQFDGKHIWVGGQVHLLLSGTARWKRT